MMSGSNSLQPEQEWFDRGKEDAWVDRSNPQSMIRKPLAFMISATARERLNAHPLSI